MSTTDSFTERHWNAVHSWALALANMETCSRPHVSFWCGFEMGVRDALFSVLMDMGWSADEWEAVETAAHKQAEEMIAKHEENNKKKPA